LFHVSAREIIVDYASPRFRWVICQLETLRRSAQRNLRGILEKLPKTLDETYERVLNEINEDNRGHARRLLHCLAFAIRPLSAGELAEILAFDFDDAPGGIPTFHASWRWKNQEEAVLSTCSSLISVVDTYVYPFGTCRVVQFSHFSVKEFLISDRLASSTGDVCQYHILPGSAHTILAQACLGFLLHFDDHINKQSVRAFPLTKYAAEYWVAHAQYKDVSSRVKDGALCLFNNRPCLLTWLEMFDENEALFLHEFPETPNPLYFASLYGFHDLVEQLVINHPQLVNSIYGRLDTPLVAALCREHFRAAEFLLQHGGNVDVRGRREQTPLHITISEVWLVDGNGSDMVSFLLKHGADVNSRNDDLCTPLHLAAKCELLEVAKMLLDSGADIDARNDKGETPLHQLFEHLVPEIKGSDDVDHLDPRLVRLFVENGADVEAQDNDRTTPLYLAIGRKSCEAVQILLEHGVKPDVTKKYDDQTSLHQLLYHSSFSQDLDLARLLLEHGAIVNAHDRSHETPLHLAVSRAYEIAELLLEHDADPNARDGDGGTPLHRLLSRTSPEDRVQVLSLVQSLLERGANLNAQDIDDSTPLHLAIECGLFEVAQILLKRSAEPNVENKNGKTPLHLLLEREYPDEDRIGDVLVVEQLLLECGADVHAQDKENISPLQLASNHQIPEIAHIILDHAYAEKERCHALLDLSLRGE
jgi:ankyrin repeat protein